MASALITSRLPVLWLPAKLDIAEPSMDALISLIILFGANILSICWSISPSISSSSESCRPAKNDTNLIYEFEG